MASIRRRSLAEDVIPRDEAESRAAAMHYTTPASMRGVLALVLAAGALAPSVALDNGLALSPPMGFANWNGFGCNYNDTTFRQQADYLNSSGMAAAGYRTMIIQECITLAGHRDANGVPQPDPKKFPYGIKGLCDYIHSKGLLCGIYTDVGPKTCAGWEGSFNHDEIDAKTYAEWGIDFVEEDSCHHAETAKDPHAKDGQPIPYSELYGRMRDALNKTGRPIVFYMCVQGQENVQEWGPTTGNLWRTTGDICGPGHATWGGVIRNFYGDTRYPNSTMVGAWQDPDMLEVGMEGLTELEWRTHFSLWAMAAAPLWVGIDMTKMPAAALQIFLNKDVIAVDQDPLGIMATCRDADGCLPPTSAGHSGHNQLTLVPCGPDAPIYNYTDADSITGGGALIASNGDALTAQGCGTGPGDPIIGGYPPVPGSCNQKPGHPTNQAVKMLPLDSSKSKGAFELRMQQDGTCVAASANLAVATAKCGDGTTVAPGQGWKWTANKQLESLTWPTKCLGDGSLPAPPAGGQVWARPLKGAAGETHVAIMLFNPSEASANVTATWAQVGLPPGKKAVVLDLWTKKSAELTELTANVPPHGGVMVTATASSDN